jgi:DNA-binding IclR family transcriptional regulator
MERLTEEATGIQVIARVADILRALRLGSPDLSQAEIAEQVGLARSTIHRLLNALEDEGLVESDGPRSRYRLGPVVAQLADTARHGMLGGLRPILEGLSREVSETVDLSVLGRTEATFVDQVIAPHRLRAASAVGEAFPLHCTANGKAFLAAMPPHDLARALSGTLHRFTEHTITDPDALEAELAGVRAEGVAYDREEHTEGICAVGTVIHGLTGLFVAVSIPVPTPRFYGREDGLRDALLRWARRAEADLGDLEEPKAGPRRRG